MNEFTSETIQAIHAMHSDEPVFFRDRTHYEVYGEDAMTLAILNNRPTELLHGHPALRFAPEALNHYARPLIVGQRALHIVDKAQASKLLAKAQRKAVTV